MRLSCWIVSGRIPMGERWMRQLKDDDLFLELRADGREGIRVQGVFIEFLLPGERPDAIITCPWEWRKTPGAVMRACQKCGMAVSLAPSSQEVLQEHPGVPIYCITCSRELLEKEENDAG